MGRLTPPRLDVSVVMATRNRGRHIGEAVTSIADAALAEPSVRVEIVLVDNGSTDDTPAVLRDLEASCPVPLHALSEPVAGVSRARNRGLAAAAGEVIVVTDDDCRLERDYFTALLRHYADPAAPKIVGGRVELGDPLDLPFTIKTEPEPSSLDGLGHPGGFILGANMAASREVFRLIGGFDERFGAAGVLVSAEDTELFLRAHLVGVPVAYAPDLVVHHFHGRRTLDEVARLSRAYQIGNGAMIAKHGRAYPLLLRHLWWNGRNALRELVGGPLFDPHLKISHADIFFANLRGIALYVKAKALKPGHRTALAIGAPVTL